MIVDIGPNLTNAINGFFTAATIIIICWRVVNKWDGAIRFFKKDEHSK